MVFELWRIEILLYSKTLAYLENDLEVNTNYIKYLNNI